MGEWGDKGDKADKEDKEDKGSFSPCGGHERPRRLALDLEAIFLYLPCLPLFLVSPLPHSPTPPLPTPHSPLPTPPKIVKYEL
ncbi:hypothetical protein [Tolypothrix sp. VBCCA 56010]|uniref:hypothetical protein n=1 Tax=Tolypothrix sp. VBCCA 56010 TaxID=3137731 RepID=UPI003D7EAFF4